MIEKIFMFDSSRFSDALKIAIQNGQAIIRDGVAYYRNGGGIIQHMPLKEVTIDLSKSLSTVVSSLQSSIMIASTISTGVIVGAIIIQTAYLSNKINKLHVSINKVEKDVKSLYVMNYITHLSEYAGMIESARCILKNESKAETADLAAILLVNIASKRNELSLLISNLIDYSNELTDDHLMHLLDFIILILELMPKFVYVEAMLSDRYEKFGYTNIMLEQSKKSYKERMKEFSNWCKNKKEDALIGKSHSVFLQKAEELKLFFTDSKKYNYPLLERTDEIWHHSLLT